MRKKLIALFASMCMIISMLPTTVLAAGSNTVYVGGVALAGSSDGIVYATTNESGEVVKDGANANNYNIKWDGSTLTLHDATIQKELYASDLPLNNIAGAAIGVINQSGDAGLTVQLEGNNNKIEGVSTGINVRSSGGNAALNITGNGTLVVNSNYLTIQVTSIGGNAALSIENAKVTATSSYSNVVTVQSGNSENSSASLTVDGGSLTATAPSNNVSGIRFVFGSGGSGSGTPNLTVSGNATVRANGSAGGITNNSSTGIQYGTGGKETGGIIWNGTEGTVYGNVTLQEDLEIGTDETLTIGEDGSLTIPDGKNLTNNGTIKNNGSIINKGTLNGDVGGMIESIPKITTTNMNEGTVGSEYSQKLEAEGNNIKWSFGNLPEWLKLDEKTDVISGTPTKAGTYNFTVTAENKAGSDSESFEIKINEKSGGGGAVIPPSPTHTEIIGKDRYETAALIADEIGYYDTAVLVNAENTMSDGLSASALSGKYNAPILLTKKDSIPDSTVKRLKKASTIYIIGGENAISENVEKELSGKKVIRIGGSNRYETSELIAEHIGNYDRAFIVNGLEGEADAMSASAVSSKYNAPIILTDGKNSDYNKKSDTKYYAIGGEEVLSDSIVSEYNAERISGDDRYETNREVIDKFYSSSSKYYFTNGNTLVDALSASLPAKNCGIVLVSSKSDNSVLEDKNTVQVGGMDFEISAK